MSGFFNRLNYDRCAYGKTLNESVGPFQYRTDPIAQRVQEDCKMNYPGFNVTNLAGRGINIAQVDVSSELRNQTRSASKCPSEKYIPQKYHKKCNMCKNCGSGLPCGCLHCMNKMYNTVDCEREIIPIQSRSFGGCSDLNGIYINRFIPLVENPQELQKIHSNDTFGLDSRNYTKDQANVKYNFKEMAKTAHFTDNTNQKFNDFFKDVNPTTFGRGLNKNNKASAPTF